MTDTQHCSIKVSFVVQNHTRTHTQNKDLRLLILRSTMYLRLILPKDRINNGESDVNAIAISDTYGV